MYIYTCNIIVIIYMYTFATRSDVLITANAHMIGAAYK